MAPTGQKYLQKMRSEKREAMTISRSRAPPNVIRYEKVFQPLYEEYCPKTVQGLKVSIETESVQVTTRRTKTAYLIHFSFFSILAGIVICLIFSFLAMKFRSSCMLPNAHIYPQKNRPQRIVIGSTASSRAIDGPVEASEKVP